MRLKRKVSQWTLLILCLSFSGCPEHSSRECCSQGTADPWELMHPAGKYSFSSISSSPTSLFSSVPSLKSGFSWALWHPLLWRLLIQSASWSPLSFFDHGSISYLKSSLMALSLYSHLCPLYSRTHSASLEHKFPFLSVPQGHPQWPQHPQASFSLLDLCFYSKSNTQQGHPWLLIPRQFICNISHDNFLTGYFSNRPHVWTVPWSFSVFLFACLSLFASSFVFIWLTYDARSVWI